MMMVKQNLHDHFWRDKILDKSTRLSSRYANHRPLTQTLNEYMSIMMMSMCALCSVEMNDTRPRSRCDWVRVMLQ